MKALEVGESCGTHEEEKRSLCEVLVQKLEKSSHSDDLSVCGRVILRRILKIRVSF